MAERRQRPDRLTEALRDLVGRRAHAAPPPGDLPARLAAVEREVHEVRTRVNALFFAVLTVALTDVVVRAVVT